jgi:hypothetical protein
MGIIKKLQRTFLIMLPDGIFFFTLIQIAMGGSSCQCELARRVEQRASCTF